MTTESDKPDTAGLSPGDRDRDLQDSLDRGDPVNAGDARTYMRLYKALAARPVGNLLPTSFAYQVMSRILAKRLSAKESAASLTSVLVSGLALVLGLGSIFLVSAAGYGDSPVLGSIGQLARSVPASLMTIAASVLTLVAVDLMLGYRRVRKA